MGTRPITILALTALAACGGGGGGGGGKKASGGNPDVTPPTVAMASPGAGSLLAGSVTLGANASDDTGVVGVRFLIDGTDLGPEIVAAPWQLAWDTTLVADGSHLVSAVARDAAGNEETATALNVTVDNAPPADLDPPVVALVPPGSNLTDVVATSATASDPSGIASVQFLLDGAPLGLELESAPWTVDWDTLTAVDGSHSLRAVAWDGAGNMGLSNPIDVDVQNGDVPNAVNFSTFFGGTGDDTARDVCVDHAGYLYVTGGTDSADMTTTPGAYDRTYNGVHDVWVAKFTPDGELVFATYVGGPNYDRAYAIEVDAAGYIYVAGRSGEGFPTTPGALQETFGGEVVGSPKYGLQDGFVFKLSPEGDSLVWSTYFGNEDPSPIRDIDVNDAGEVYLGVTRVYRPHPHITPGAFDTTLDGPADVMLAKLSADGSSVLWGTYLGGSDDDGGTPSVRVDDAGNVLILTHSRSSDAPVTPGAYQSTWSGELDMLLAKFSPSGNLLFCTYFGGSQNEFTETHGLALDAAGNAFICATTVSPDLPPTPASAAPFQGTFGGATSGTSNYGGDGFLAKIRSDGRALLGFTYLGGSGGEGIEGAAVSADGSIAVSGGTSSSDFPVTLDAPQGSLDGQGELFFSRLSPDLSTLEYSSYQGGALDDVARGLDVYPSGGIVCAGMTRSADYPTSVGAWDSVLTGTIDILLFRVDL